MSSATLRLVLLVSCCHGLVHVWEHSLASVEQLIAQDGDFGIPATEHEQKKVTGGLGTCLRAPFGLCALLAGWLADRFGSKRLLLVYLLGCSLAVLLAFAAPNLAVLFVAMFTLGMFASIYHPAGVGLITHHTTPENRPRALGCHGVFGSAGIAAGPFLAAIVLTGEATWRQYYLVLAIPGLLLAVLLALRLARLQEQAGVAVKTSAADGEDDAHWPSYFMLIGLASVAGFVYAAILHFLPRYMDEAGLRELLEISRQQVPDKGLRNYLAGTVLLLGMAGQYAAGRIARPATLEPLMAAAFFGCVPCVLAMAFAEGTSRIWVAGLFSPLFFMHQPLYNSLVAKYVPRRRRSLCYGLSFTLGFGVGALGPSFAGFARSDLMNFGTLAALLAAAGALSLVLWRWHGPVVKDEAQPPGNGASAEEALS